MRDLPMPGSAQGFEPTRNDARTQHLPSGHRFDDALHRDGAEIAVFEESADEPTRAGRNHDRVRLCQGLHPGGQVRRFTDDRLFPSRSFADRIADHDEPGCDPDARLQFAGPDIEAADGVDRAQPRPNRPLGIILMRSRIAEINHHAVAHVLADKAVEPGGDLGDGAMISGDDLAQILGIEARGERHHADEIADHHRQLPPLGR